MSERTHVANVKKYHYIDISGLGNSGKSAAVDFLREFQKIGAPEFSFEFDLFRLPNGILDLHYHLVEDWTLIKSNYAIVEFRKLTKTLAGSRSRRPIYDALFSAGTGYEKRFKNSFGIACREYINSFIIGKFLTFWPYLLICDNPAVRFYKKILIKFKFKKSLLSPIFLVNGKNFKEKTTQFINTIFSNFFEHDYQILTFNNTFEPFNPIRSLDILENSKIIIVTRDPRDVYVSGLNHHKVQKKDLHLQAFDNNGINKSFLGTDDLNLFVARQKIFFEKLYKGNDSRVKIIRFEDLNLKYESVTKEIIKFINLVPDDHTHPKKYFNPEISKKNIGIWKKYSNQEEINFIYNHLKEYCFEE